MAVGLTMPVFRIPNSEFRIGFTPAHEFKAAVVPSRC